MGYGWEGKLVRLAPIDVDKHLANSQRWINDPEVSHNLVFGDYPTTIAAHREWLERASKKSDCEVIFAIEILTGEHIGFSSIFDINWKDGTGLTGSLIGSKDHWGKGYGTDASNIRTRYAFEVLGLRYLISGAFPENERSLRMLKNSGYVECGCYPQRIWRRGRYVDEVQLYLTREMWLNRSESESKDRSYRLIGREPS